MMISKKELKLIKKSISKLSDDDLLTEYHTVFLRACNPQSELAYEAGFAMEDVYELDELDEYYCILSDICENELFRRNIEVFK